MKKIRLLLSILLITLIPGCIPGQSGSSRAPQQAVVQLEDIPEFDGEPSVEINGNEPEFDESEITTDAFEEYSELDDLDRCGTAFGCIGEELMPTEERQQIGQIRPSGWHTVKYDCVDQTFLYNRCHLIAFMLAGENANEKNLITGTRYMNVEGMLPYENMVADYIHETGNHVMYRVTPIFTGDNLVADGVEMEALSVEDDGEGICFHVFAYNTQPGIDIDYKTGLSQLDEEEETGEQKVYILNTNTKKFHDPDCASVQDMNPENSQKYKGTRHDLMQQGYEPCGRCSP